MSIRVANSALFASSMVVSRYAGHGVRGDQIPTTGEHGGSFLQDSANVPADNAVEFRFEIQTGPTGGASFTALNEDGSFALSVPGDGSYSWTFRVWADGVDQGIATATVTVGAAGVTLVVSNAGSDAGAGVVAVSQAHALSVSDAGAGAGADTPPVSQSHILLVLGAGSDSGADTVLASTDPVASVADAGADSGADAVQAIQDVLLAVASAGSVAGATSIVVIESAPGGSGSGLTAEQDTLLREIHNRLGLESGDPLVHTRNPDGSGSFVSSRVQIALTGDGVTTSVETRQ